MSIAQGGNVNVRSNVLPKFRPLFRSIYTIFVVYEAEELLRRSGVTSYTPLYISSKMGHVKVVDLLIENGADIESPLGHRRRLSKQLLNLANCKWFGCWSQRGLLAYYRQACRVYG